MPEPSEPRTQMKCQHVWQNKGRSLVIGDAYRVVCFECGKVFVTGLKEMLRMTKKKAD